MLIFVKLGGSLITDKFVPFTARKDVLARLAGEISQARETVPHLSLVIGHGSGSYGHIAAQKFGPRSSPKSPDQWHGFLEVWQAAHQLNQIVLETLQVAGLPVVTFPPSASTWAKSCKILRWDVSPIRQTIDGGLIPLLFGDAVLDEDLGWTILSTEDLFVHLSSLLKPERILLAGIEEGVWGTYSKKDHLIPVITPKDKGTIPGTIAGSKAVDVTGGMADKVTQMLELVARTRNIRVSIFSGMAKGQLLQALGGEFPGTTICNEGG